MKKAPLFTLCFKLITLTIFLTLLVTTNQSFAQTPLIKYIKSNKYEPFTIPRTDWGVGTTITFKKGQEEIVAFNDNCLQLTPENTNSFIPNSTYEITNKNSFELNLGKLFGDKLNIEAAFKNKRVKKVVITVTDVKETVIPTILVSQKIEDFAKNNNKS
ncbi:MAG: hypothetical protein ABUL44_00985, partial [Flavobacterium sp.]